MYQLTFYVPESDLEKVKQALFAKGAGRMGNYDHCAWQVLGQGQFKPLPGSDPAIGEINQLEKVAEYKVEIICDDEHVEEVVATLKQVHPYEEPAYTVWRINESFY